MTDKREARRAAIREARQAEEVQARRARAAEKMDADRAQRYIASFTDGDVVDPIRLTAAMNYYELTEIEGPHGSFKVTT